MNPKKLSDAQVAQRIKKLKGWQRTPAGEIAKTYKFKDYHQTMAFVNATAWVSHATNHHPDLEVGYDKCRVRYSTHSVGGLSASDFDCAAKIDALLK